MAPQRTRALSGNTAPESSIRGHLRDFAHCRKPAISGPFKHLRRKFSGDHTAWLTCLDSNPGITFLKANRVPSVTEELFRVLLCVASLTSALQAENALRLHQKTSSLGPPHDVEAAPLHCNLTSRCQSYPLLRKPVAMPLMDKWMPWTT